MAWATSRKDALDMLTLASMLHRRLDEATARRSRAACSSPSAVIEREGGNGDLVCVAEAVFRVYG